MDREPSKKSVLIVSYLFPPYPGVGGRRWSKFAKYLHKSGFDVKVITTEQRNSRISPSAPDIQLYRNKISYLKTGLSAYLGIVPNTIVEKVLYRIALWRAKLFAKGNYYDRSIFLEKQLLKKIEDELLKK